MLGQETRLERNFPPRFDLVLVHLAQMSAASSSKKALATAPLRFSAVFAQMLTECPAQIAAYGGCIKTNIDNIAKDSCSKEFAALKACSEKVIKSRSSKRR